MNLTRREVLATAAATPLLIPTATEPDPMPAVTITHPDDSTETIDETVGYRWERAIGELFKLVITVDRADAQSVTLDRKEDELDLAGVTTTRLVDYNTGGSTWELIGYDWSWDGKLEQPSAGGLKETDTDDALVTGIVGDIPVLSVGTINQVEGSLTLTSNHAQPHERLRKLEGKTSGEVRVNADKTLDYVDQLGSDKTGSVTLSEANGNIEGEIRVQNRGRKIDATHVKVTGAHEGEAQYVANLVPASDGRSYADRVDYTTTRWSDSSDDDWDVWNAPEAASQSEVDSIANELADDLTDEHVEATATVPGEDLVLGDRVTVQKDDAGIDREMRVIRIVTRTVGDTPADTVDEVTLSTHSVARDTDQRRKREQNEVSVAYEGSSVVINSDGGQQPVTSAHDYTMGTYYPGQIEFEHRVNLRIQADRFVAPIQGTDYPTDASIVSTSGNFGTDSISTEGSWVRLGYTIDSDFDAGLMHFTIQLRVTNKSSIIDLVDLRVLNVDTGDGFAPKTVDLRDDFIVADFLVPIEHGTLDDFDFQIQFLSDNDTPYDIDFSWSTAQIAAHRHLPRPGVKDSFGDVINERAVQAPSDCTLYVNGVQQTTDPFFQQFYTPYDDGAGDADWTSVATANGANVTFDRQASLLRAETDTTAGDARAEGVWYWDVSPDLGYAPLENVDTVGGGQNTTLEADTTAATSGVACTVHDDPSVTLANTPNDQVIGTQTDQTSESAFLDFDTPPFADFDATGKKLKFHVFGEDGDDCILRIRHVTLAFNYGYNGPHDVGVDLVGVLDEDAFNKFRIESATTGELKGNLNADLYRQIGTQ